VICNDEDTDGRARATTDEDWGADSAYLNLPIISPTRYQ